jgi:hypothetical protein
MFFGHRHQDKQERGVPSVIRRQLITQGLLLVMVLGLGLMLATMLRRSDSSIEAPAGVPAAWPDEEEALLLELGELREALPPEPFVEKPEILFAAAAKDRTGEIDAPSVAYLLQKIRAGAGEGLEEAPLLSARRGDEVWTELLERPDLYRGKLVEVRGNLVAPSPRQPPLALRGIDFPNPSGLDRVYRSHLYGDSGKFYAVDTFEKQPAFSHMDGVLLRGYFCQLYKYDVELRGRMAQAVVPFLVGASYERMGISLPSSFNALQYLPYAVLVAGGAALAIFVISRRGRKAYEARRLSARKQVQRKGE